MVGVGGFLFHTVIQYSVVEYVYGRFPKFHSVFVGPRPWHIEIRHRVKKTSTINLFGFETLKLRFRRLKLWKPTVQCSIMQCNVVYVSASLLHALAACQVHLRTYECVCIYIYIHTYTYICIYIDIYIYIQRERERDLSLSLSLSLFLSLYIYIHTHIHIHIHTHVCIYIYIYIQRERERERYKLAILTRSPVPPRLWEPRGRHGREVHGLIILIIIIIMIIISIVINTHTNNAITT